MGTKVVNESVSDASLARGCSLHSESGVIHAVFNSDDKSESDCSVDSLDGGAMMPGAQMGMGMQPGMMQPGMGMQPGMMQPGMMANQTIRPATGIRGFFRVIIEMALWVC